MAKYWELKENLISACMHVISSSSSPSIISSTVSILLSSYFFKSFRYTPFCKYLYYSYNSYFFESFFHHIPPSAYYLYQLSFLLFNLHLLHFHYLFVEKHFDLFSSVSCRLLFSVIFDH